MNKFLKDSIIKSVLSVLVPVPICADDFNFLHLNC
jgi:hypothetical protein